MQLIDIDKNRYRRHYRIVFAAIIAVLVVVSLGFSSGLIRYLGDPDGSNFMFNLVGVVVAGIVASLLIYRFREHPFMHEVVYVWKLKQELNRIYRKQRKIEPLIDENNLDAMIIMNYMYQGSKQLYLLDDNTITMENLTVKIAHLNSISEAAGVTLSTDQYDAEMLSGF